MVCPLAQFDPLNVRMKCDVPVTSPAFFTRFCVRVAKPHCRSRNDHKLRLSDVAQIAQGFEDRGRKIALLIWRKLGWPLPIRSREQEARLKQRTRRLASCIRSRMNRNQTATQARNLRNAGFATYWTRLRHHCGC